MTTTNEHHHTTRNACDPPGMEDLLARQTCFGVQNRVRNLMHSWTRAQIQARLKTRQVSTDAELEQALVQELYLMEATQLRLLTRTQLETLARRIDLTTRLPDVDLAKTTEPQLAHWILMVVVRDQIPRRVVQRRLIIDLPRQPRRSSKTCRKRCQSRDSTTPTSLSRSTDTAKQKWSRNTASGQLEGRLAYQ